VLGYTAGKGEGEPAGDDTVVLEADKSSVGLQVDCEVAVCNVLSPALWNNIF